MSSFENITSEPSLIEGPVLTQTSWYAVHTRPRHEKKVAGSLLEKGIRTFLPLRSEKHKWSDRQRIVHAPIFPGYVFVQVAPILPDRVSVLRTNGVAGFVGQRGMGVPIPESQIAAVQALIEQGVAFQPHPFLTVGQRVRIRSGSLDGLEGIIMAVHGGQNLVVSIDLIQRSIAIRLEGYEIEPV